MGKYLWILVGLVVVAVAYFFGGKWTGQNVGLETGSPSPSSVAGTAKSTVKKNITPAPAPATSYTQLVKEYIDRRIQFSDSYYGNCEATPSSPVFKNGASILLDNRTSSAKVITVGANKYSLAAYGYQVVTLSSSNLPKELLLSCGSTVNTGKILLQAQILQ